MEGHHQRFLKTAVRNGISIMLQPFEAGKWTQRVSISLLVSVIQYFIEKPECTA